VPTERLSNVEGIYSLETMSDLNRIFMPYFDWKKFLNKFLKIYESNETLNDSDSIIVMGFEYFEALKGLLDEYHSTQEKEKTLKFTMLFHFIKFSLPLLSKEYRTQFSAIGEALTGSMALERWQTCIDHTDSIFGLGYAVTKMFLRAVPNNSKQLAQDLIHSIKQSFIDNFHKLKWMDKETGSLAEEKVNYVDELIGYPDFVENDTALNYRYKELNMSEDDYFGNEIRLVQYALKSEILTYRTRVNKAE
jgi:membrane metallo-endopeptidase-like protein 1